MYLQTIKYTEKSKLDNEHRNASEISTNVRNLSEICETDGN
jgi:hypothetical protein